MKQKLEELLAQLHAELASADALDEGAKEQLRNAAREIEAAVGPDNDKQLGEDTLDQLENAALSFESEYPRLSAVVNNIADTLAKLGI